jgi:hypothetical protein
MTVSWRKIELARAVWGLGLLCAPRWTLHRVHRIEVDATSVWVARVLGARQVAQATLSGASPSPEILALGVWVDLAHASSALALAVVDRSRASAGLTDTAVASVWAVRGWHDLRVAPVPRPTHDRRRDAMARAVLGRVPGGAPLRRMVRARGEGEPA